MKEGSRRFYGNIAERRGIESENNVYNAFRRRDDVVYVRKTPKWSPEDQAGIDVVAVMAQPESDSTIPKVTTLYVQVKSSEHGIEHFIKRKKRKLGLTRAQVQQRFMLVNGQRSHSAIDNSISKQAEQMGIIEPRPQFLIPKPGQEIQIYPPPAELKRAA